jgi:hypothetical protein
MCTSGVSFTFLAETNEYGAAAHGCILLSFKIIQRQFAGALAGLFALADEWLRRVDRYGADDPETAPVASVRILPASRHTSGGTLRSPCFRRCRSCRQIYGKFVFAALSLRLNSRLRSRLPLNSVYHETDSCLAASY